MDDRSSPVAESGTVQTIPEIDLPQPEPDGPEPFVSKWPQPKPRSRPPLPVTTPRQWLCLLLALAVAFTWFRKPAVVPPCHGDLVCGRPLDVNYATPEALQRISGVGPSTSARIVQGRPYQSVDELTRVRGIGPKTLDRLRPWLDTVHKPPAPPPPPPPLDPNTATLDQLESLPKIGPALAARIAAGRPYDHVEDLLRVKGIGPKTLAAIQPRLAIGPREEAP